jgi:hypothetical protein
VYHTPASHDYVVSAPKVKGFMAKTTKKKASKQVDVDSMEQAHGAIQAPRSVQDMLGNDDGYTVDSVEEYLAQIQAMSDSDLHNHSVLVKVTPALPRSRLEDRLEKQFLIRRSRKIFQPTMVPMTDEALKRQQRLMQGRSW